MGAINNFIGPALTSKLISLFGLLDINIPSGEVGFGRENLLQTPAVE
jgi:hypothetical protein